MAGTKEGANCVIEDTGTVCNAVTGTTISQSQSIGVNELQMAGDTGVGLCLNENFILVLLLFKCAFESIWYTYAKLTPSRGGSSNSAYIAGAHSDLPYLSIESDNRGSLNGGNIIG